MDGPLTRQRAALRSRIVPRATPAPHSDDVFAIHRYWFGTTDIDPAKPSLRGLSYEEIVHLLDGTDSRQRLLLLDTCHAGEVDPETVLPPSGQVEDRGPRMTVREVRSTAALPPRSASLKSSFDLLLETFADLRHRTGTVVLSASGGAEYSLESARWQNGAFTFALREALGDLAADRDGNGRVTVSELYGYLVPRVDELTRGGQQPTARQENRDLDFIVR